MTAIANISNIKPTHIFNFSGSRSVDPRISCSRNSTATVFDSSKTLKTVGINVPRINHDPVSGECLGLLVEESRKNFIPNSSTSGAVVGIVGSGGSLPSAWSSTSGNGIITEVMAIGYEQGLPYVDIKFSGTSTGNYQGLVFGNVSGFLASTVYCNSVYVKLIAGSLPAGGSIQNKIRFNHSTGTIDANAYIQYTDITNQKLVSDRFSVTGSSPSNATGPGQMLVLFNYPVGTVLNFTIRAALPQLEEGSFMTSPIITTGTVATRQGDNISTNLNLADLDFSVAVKYRTGLKLSNIRSFSLRNNSEGKILEFFGAGSAGTNRNGVVVSGSAGNPAINLPPAENTVYGSAFSVSGNTFSAASEGNLMVTGATHTLVTPYNAWFGTAGLGTTLHLCGHIKIIQIFSTAVTNEQLKQLSL